MKHKLIGILRNRCCFQWIFASFCSWGNKDAFVWIFQSEKLFNLAVLFRVKIFKWYVLDLRVPRNPSKSVLWTELWLNRTLVLLYTYFYKSHSHFILPTTLTINIWRKDCVGFLVCLCVCVCVYFKKLF